MQGHGGWRGGGFGAYRAVIRDISSLDSFGPSFIDL
jgi:hypothetical protein